MNADLGLRHGGHGHKTPAAAPEENAAQGRGKKNEDSLRGRKEAIQTQLKVLRFQKSIYKPLSHSFKNVTVETYVPLGMMDHKHHASTVS